LTVPAIVGTYYLAIDMSYDRVSLIAYESMLRYDFKIIIAMMVFGVGAGIIATNYLSKSKTVDFYGALPINKRKVFLSAVIVEYTVSVAIIVLSMLLGLAISFVVNGYFIIELNASYFLLLLKNVILYFTMYFSLGVLSGVLCGRLYSKIILVVTAWFSKNLIFLICYRAFKLDRLQLSELTTNFIDAFSKLLRGGFDIDIFHTYDITIDVNLIQAIMILCCSAFLIFIAFIFINKRKMELNKKEYNSALLTFIIKYVVLINIYTWFFNSFHISVSTTFKSIFGFVLVAFFIFAVCNVIINGNIKKAFSGIAVFPVFLVLYVFIYILLFKFVPQIFY